MSRFLAVTALALRELWISFRLLALIGLLLLSALPSALLSGPTEGASLAAATRLQPFAIALAAAISLMAGIVAGTLSAERRRGTAGWLVSRAVPRGTIVTGWFAAFAVVLLLGILPAAGLAWLTLGNSAETIDPMAYFVSVGASAAVGTAGVGAGLVLGALLGVLPGMAVGALVSAAVLLPAAIFGVPALGTAPAPGAPFASLADMVDAARPIGDAVRTGGLALAAAGGLLIAAAAVMSRADL